MTDFTDNETVFDHDTLLQFPKCHEWHLRNHEHLQRARAEARTAVQRAEARAVSIEADLQMEQALCGNDLRRANERERSLIGELDRERALVGSLMANLSQFTHAQVHPALLPKGGQPGASRPPHHLGAPQATRGPFQSPPATSSRPNRRSTKAIRRCTYARGSQAYNSPRENCES